MPRSYRYLHYDVFTDRLFGGNQLAVFLDGRGLSNEVMQSIAKEINFSEPSYGIGEAILIKKGNPKSIKDLVHWSGGLYEPPARFRNW